MCPMKARFRLAGFELLNQYISTPFLQERKLKYVTVRLTYVFIILIKFPPKKLQAVKVEQLNFLSENLKEIFPRQLPDRKYAT